MEFLKKSIEIEEANSQAFLTMGEVYLKQKDYAQAEDAIRKALNIYSRLENGYFTLGQVLEAKGDYKEAVECYKKELEYYPDNFFAAFSAGEALKNNNAYDQAVPYFRKAIEIRPGFKLSYFMIANYYLQIGENLSKAVELCKVGIGLPPQDESTLYGYFLLTELYKKLGDTTQARFYSAEGDKLMRKLK